MTRTAVRHLTGFRAAATVAVGLGLAACGVGLLFDAVHRPDGWIFLAVAGAGSVALGILAGALPWRITTVFEEDELVLGWALGRRRIPWTSVRSVVIGPLGSGGERDPVAVSLYVDGGHEILYAALGRRRAQEVPSVAPLLEAAKERGIPVEDVMAPRTERRERAKRWREARMKGWR